MVCVCIVITFVQMVLFCKIIVFLAEREKLNVPTNPLAICQLTCIHPLLHMW